MKEKSRPRFLSPWDLFQKAEMADSLTNQTRGIRLIAFIFLLLFALTPLTAQTSVPAPSISLPGSQSPFTGSEPEGNATSEVLQLSFQEAIDRGLRNNLGLLLSGDQTPTERCQS